MKPAARVQAIIDLLDRIYIEDRPADMCAGDYLRRRRYIGSKDRTWIINQLYALLRRQARLSWWIEQRAGVETTPRRWVIAYMVLSGQLKADTLVTWFDGSRYAPPPLGAEEEKLLATVAGQTLEHPDMPERVRAECPAWAETSLRQALGPAFMEEMQAMTQEFGAHLRINPNLATPEDVYEGLAAEGISTEPGLFAPNCLRVSGRPNLVVHPLFKKGAIEIQDESSQVAALMVDARPGMQVLDFCAGAGGKSLAIGLMMENRGRVVATDVLSGKLAKAKDRARRAGLHNVETRTLKSENDRWFKRQHKKFDRVLVDAPCTGTGTWGRNPDARWREKVPRPEDVTPIQASILRTAARLVKPGGKLIYATCSLLPEENEEQVAALLADRPDYSAIPLSEALTPSIAGANDGVYLNMRPGAHGTNGFFAVSLRRSETDMVPDPAEEGHADEPALALADGSTAG